MIEEKTSQVPSYKRAEICDEHSERIVEQISACKGNIVRVQEELAASGIEVSYSTLTRYCRVHGIKKKPIKVSGEYHFSPGEEMQHDTSPHEVIIGGKKRKVQCASVVLGHSRLRFEQVYPTFDRFYCKVFLTQALQAFGGSAGRCIVDNTSVVVAHGSGKRAVMAPEMVAFAQRYSFEFVAHEIGDANRSALVEQSFWHTECNFYPGRNFESFSDLNEQLAAWCRRDWERRRRSLQARPIDLYQTERLYLKPLPAHIPEVYEQKSRLVSLQGYVSFRGNHYSVPYELVGQRVDARASIDRVRVFHHHQLVAEHGRHESGQNKRLTLAEHKVQQRWTKEKREAALPQEEPLRRACEESARMVEQLKRVGRGRGARQIQMLYRMYLDYPLEPFRKALAEALVYGLTDLARIEQMMLERIKEDFFRLGK